MTHAGCPADIDRVDSDARCGCGRGLVVAAITMLDGPEAICRACARDIADELDEIAREGTTDAERPARAIDAAGTADQLRASLQATKEHRT